MNLGELETLIRKHARANNIAALDEWLTYETLCRYKEWVPAPLGGERRLVDIGCCQPSIGYYFHLGWTDVVGFFKEAGDNSDEAEYTVDNCHARTARIDVELERIPVDDGWADVVLMME